MAKKKKSARKKKSDVEAVERSPFWPLSWAIAMILGGLLLMLGGFGAGGPLPVNLFHGTYWLFGWAAYLAPFALAYWGVFKFGAEGHKLPRGNAIGGVAVVLFS